MKSHALNAVLVLAALAVTSFAQGVNPADRRPPFGTPNAAAVIQEPADPDAPKGTYELDGEVRTLTKGAFYETYLRLKAHESRPEMPLQERTVVEHILLFAEAEHYGFALTPEEVELIHPAKAQPLFADSLRQRWQSMGVSEQDVLRYMAEKRAIQRMKDWYATSVRVNSQDLFDLWKRDNQLYRVTYVQFEAPSGTGGEAQPTDEQLRDFYATNAKVQNELRIQQSVSADVVTFDPTSVSSEELERLRSTRKVSREEALEFFSQHRARLDQQIPSDQRPRMYPPASGAAPALDALVTPFQLLQSQIENEILLGDRIQSAFSEAAGTKNSAEVEGLAKKHGLKHTRLENLTRSDAAALAAEFGPTFFNTLFSAEVGNLPPEIQYHGTTQFFWRLGSKTASALPPFEDVRDRLIEPWRQEQAASATMTKAQEFLSSVESSAQSDTAEKEAEIDRRAIAEAEKAIETLKITDPRQQSTERQKAMAAAENEKRMLRSQAMPAHFERRAQEQGLLLREMGPFSFQPGRPDVRGVSVEESRVGFIRSSYQIKALGEGFVSPILQDAETGTLFVVRVDAREDPPFEDMSAVDYHQRYMAKERQGVFSQNYLWTGYQAERRLKWTPK